MADVRPTGGPAGSPHMPTLPAPYRRARSAYELFVSLANSTRANLFLALLLLLVALGLALTD